MNITQLHYTGWPDHGVPSGESMKCFGQTLEMFSDFIALSEPNEKVVVHCSAGIGRTGTIVTLMYILINIQA